MQLADEQIKEFQDIWRKEYGEDLPREKAVEYGTDLLKLVKLVLDDYMK